MSLLFCSTYTDFDNLAHAPRGELSEHGLYVYRINEQNGSLTLLNMVEGAMNPSFLRMHPARNIIYTCTESINEPGEVLAYSVSPSTGRLTLRSRESAEGTSTCYLTIDARHRHLLYVNYWDSTIGVMPMATAGLIGPPKVVLESGVKVASAKRADHLVNRQAEPHAHAIVLEPTFGRIAYVPDLGLDCIRQYVYDADTGGLLKAGRTRVGPEGRVHGPRYIVFHPSIHVAYVVNELASTVAVFEFDVTGAEVLQPGEGQDTLHLVQTISTIPPAFPKKLNTCGRVAVTPSGSFVCVSNRGHNSISVFRVDLGNGHLSVAGHYHTRGRTPRHFQFGPLGNFLYVANQDTNSLAVFRFDGDTGALEFTGSAYDVPSPNFVCATRMLSQCTPCTAGGAGGEAAASYTALLAAGEAATKKDGAAAAP